MTKKKPKGHNIGGTPKQKRRKENKGQLYMQKVLNVWLSEGKDIAGWWADGTIDDGTFVNAIQYLIKEGLIQVQT